MPLRRSSPTVAPVTFSKREIFEQLDSHYRSLEATEYNKSDENSDEYYLVMIESLFKFGTEQFPTQINHVKSAICCIVDRDFNSSEKQYLVKVLTFLNDSESDSDSD